MKHTTLVLLQIKSCLPAADLPIRRGGQDTPSRFLFFFSQRRKAAKEPTRSMALASCTWHHLLRTPYLVHCTWYLVQSLIKQIPTNPQIQEGTVAGVIWSHEIALLGHQTGIQVVVFYQDPGTINSKIQE